MKSKNNNYKKILFIGIFGILAFKFLFDFKKNKIFYTQRDYVNHTVFNYKKDEKLAFYVNKNIDKFLSSSFSFEESVRENVYTIKQAKRLVKKLKKDELISEQNAKNILFEMNNYNFPQAKKELKNIKFEKINGEILAKKEYLLGLLNEINFDYNESIENYQNAIELNSEGAEYYNKLALMYYKMDNFSKAKSILETSLGLTENNKKDNKKRIKTLSSLAKIYYRERNFDKAILYFNKAYFLAKLNNNYFNKMSIWVFMGDMGDISLQRGEYLEASHFYNNAYSLSKKLWIKKIKSYSLLKLATANYHYGDYADGLKYGKSALKIAEKINDLELKALAKYNICLNLEYLKERDLAKIYCEDSVKDMEHLIGFIKTPEFLTKLGDMVSFAASIRDYQKALKNYEKAYEISKKNNFKYNQISLLTKLGATHKNLKNTKKAFEYFKMSDKLNKILGFERSISCNECNRASAYAIDGKNKSAINSYKDGIEIALMDDDKAMLGGLYSNLGMTYIKIKDYNRALDSLQKSLDIHKQIHKRGHHYIKWSESVIGKVLTEI